MVNAEKYPRGILEQRTRDGGQSRHNTVASSRNSVCVDQKFYVAVKMGVPFDMVLEAVNPVNSETTLIHVDYNNLPIRCRYCLSISPLVKNCPSVAGKKRPQRSVNTAKSEAPKLCVRDKGKASEDNVVKNVTRKPGVEGGVVL